MVARVASTLCTGSSGTKLKRKNLTAPSAMKAACQVVFHVGYGHNGITGRHQKVAR